MRKKLQVFVSSTYTDLIEERQAAVEAILKSGHIPAGMELFKSDNKSQMTIIKRWIDESDVYMLILGARYGSVEPSSNVGYTELEYDYAIEAQKPIFAVVIDESVIESRVRDGGLALIERDNPKELSRFRDKVLSNMCSFFKEPKDIKLCIHEVMSDHLVDPKIKGWISALDVEDAKPLHEEISRLKEENRRLSDSLAQQSEKPIQRDGSTTTPSPNSISIQDIIDILKSIDIKVPDSLDLKKTTYSLSDLFYIYRNSLVNGVQTSFRMSDKTSFIYHNIGPKLQIYGLIQNESLGAYRRISATKRGLEALIEIEKYKVMQKRGKNTIPSEIEDEQQ